MFYHVSSHVTEGQTLYRNTKNNFSYCEYINNCDVSTEEKLIECYNNLCEMQAFKATKRRESKWCCEAIFEHIRKTEFSNKPSRIWGIYLSATLNDARCFLQNYRKPFIDENGTQFYSHIYKVDIPKDTQVFEFDMAIYTEADQYLQNILERGVFSKIEYEFICNKAREYWNSIMSECPVKEYLVDCDITIGERII